ncbi:hypothetical protein HAX54_026180, partial [Datura stramonium]|nr:hypothetical protein [Datura stramonium]
QVIKSASRGLQIGKAFECEVQIHYVGTFEAVILPTFKIDFKKNHRPTQRRKDEYRDHD